MKELAAQKKQVVLTSQASEFIFSQPVAVAGEFLAAIKALENYGNLGMPRAKKIDKNLFEIRVKVARNQYREFYCYAVGNIIYVLNGFVKKTQKTPLAEIRKAKAIKRGLGL